MRLQRDAAYGTIWCGDFKGSMALASRWLIFCDGVLTGLSYQGWPKDSHSGFWLNRTAVSSKGDRCFQLHGNTDGDSLCRLYGGVAREKWRMGKLTLIWLTNIPKNFIMAPSIPAVDRRSVGKKSISEPHFRREPYF